MTDIPCSRGIDVKNTTHPRMARERKTIGAMIGIYCWDQHGTRDGLCGECKGLLDYASLRLEKCPFQEGKTTCGKCPIHCYKPEMREKVKEEMRYSGPRMTFRHPILALFHLIDGMRKKPFRPRQE
jgi:hypothetical protein